jgi:hypothetical protein
MAEREPEPTMSFMRLFAAALVLALALTAAVAVASASSTSGITAAQLTMRFKQSTGDKLVASKKSSSPGHYKAFDLGVPTIAKKGKYGTFTVYLVTGPDVEAEVTDLLADGRTGALGTPGAGSIYWEYGQSIFGDSYWLAKRRYGENVVLWWTGSTPVKKTDKTFKRLHTALTKATR